MQGVFQSDFVFFISSLFETIKSQTILSFVTGCIMKKEIGFIGGGQMGEALLKGLLTAGLYSADTILLAEPNADRRAYLEATYGIMTCDSAIPVWQACGIVLLAVKPQIMSTVIATSKDQIQSTHLIITIAAGIPIVTYEKLLNNKKHKIIRVMPNTPALILQGASAICCNPHVTNNELEKAVAIFNAVGKTVILDEHYLDAVTGLSGSGPAYVFSFIEALIDAGLKTGLTRDVAEALSIQTVLGSVKLIQEKGEHPAVLRSKVTSPGGTTIAGLHVLEKNGFRGIIMDAVEAATRRATELGRQ
jgi:pyrroline-5-carboxylate reductase